MIRVRDLVQAMRMYKKESCPAYSGKRKGELEEMVAKFDLPVVGTGVSKVKPIKKKSKEPAPKKESIKDYMEDAKEEAKERRKEGKPKMKGATGKDLLKLRKPKQEPKKLTGAQADALMAMSGTIKDLDDDEGVLKRKLVEGGIATPQAGGKEARSRYFTNPKEQVLSKEGGLFGEMARTKIFGEKNKELREWMSKARKAVKLVNDISLTETNPDGVLGKIIEPVSLTAGDALLRKGMFQLDYDFLLNPIGQYLTLIIHDISKDRKTATYTLIAQKADTGEIIRPKGNIEWKKKVDITSLDVPPVGHILDRLIINDEDDIRRYLEIGEGEDPYLESDGIYIDGDQLREFRAKK